MVDLNNVEQVRKIDTLNALAATQGYDQQFLDAYKDCMNLKLPILDREIKNLVVIGTGGWSNVAASIVRSMFFHELTLPILSVPGYNLPAVVNKNSLIIVLSRFGNVEEVLSATQQSIDRGAYILAVMSGGPLVDMCKENDIPYMIIPMDDRMPRTLIAYSVLPIIIFTSRLGLMADKTKNINETIQLFRKLRERYGVEVPLKQNLAKQIASRVKGRIPLVYGSLDHYDSVADRWKRQFGENSKMMAFYNIIPNLHHDEAVGWDMERDLLSQFCLIMLRDDILDSPKIKKRKDISIDILNDRVGEIIEVYAEGISVMARMFSLIYLGDFVSLYLAVIRGIDPTPIKVIDLFKLKMAEE